MPAGRGGTVRVVVVGAGFGGLGVALRLAASGERDFLVLDAAPRVGGTWQANTYPGVACDAPSHVYSYSFAPGSWSRRFAPGGEIADYLERCVAEHGLGPHLRLATQVREAAWTGSSWRLSLADGGELRAQVLVVATGQLRVPAVPELPGLDGFTGPVVHTARWPEELDLAGRRVAVVGTGASAIQVVPAIVDEVAHLTVLQRTAPYVFPKPDAAYSPRTRRRHARLPVLPRLARAALSAGFDAFGLFFWRWPALMGLLERHHERVLARTVADPDLRAALTPRERAGCKRPLISSEYHRCFNRADVTLETDPIDSLDATGIRTLGGTRHEVDVVLLATGFQTGTFVAGLTVTGRDGRRLAEAWRDGASAYHGISVPGFPNLFLVYGPHTNLGSGSIVAMLEAQAEHVLAALRVLDAAPGRALEVRAEAHRRFAEELAPRLAAAIWSSGCASWYLDARGRDTHNWPGTVRSYRARVRALDPRDHWLLPT